LIDVGGNSDEIFDLNYLVFWTNVCICKGATVSVLGGLPMT